MKWKKISELFDFLQKSKLMAGQGLSVGDYPFYTSSETQSKFINLFQHEPGCLIFGTGGKASVHLARQKFATSTDCIVLRAKPNSKVYSPYAFHFLKSNMSLLESGFHGVGLKHISKSYLGNIEIVYPPNIDDQKRIALLLDTVDGLISERKRHLQQLDALLQSVFMQMFGDPVRNEKGWEQEPFTKIGKFISGGTPSKQNNEFWCGTFPWVSPKDMKVSTIVDSIDHISDSVFEKTSLKRISKGHLLIVVRGMILAHSFPVAVNAVDIAINQDMKAINPTKKYNVVFLQHCVTALKRQILKQITSAAHGTCRLDSSAMQKILVIQPSTVLQNHFSAIVEKVEGIKQHYQHSLTQMENLYGVLSQKAFKGELDLSRVPEVREIALEAHWTMEATCDFGQLIADLTGLDNAEKRKTIVSDWLESWIKSSPKKPLNMQDFMDNALPSIEAFIDGDEQKFYLRTAFYDDAKDWVFASLKKGTLQQTFDDIKDNAVYLRAGGEL